MREICCSKCFPISNLTCIASITDAHGFRVGARARQNVRA